MNKTANAAAVGYGAFALALWLNSMTPAGWFGPELSWIERIYRLGRVRDRRKLSLSFLVIPLHFF